MSKLTLDVTVSAEDEALYEGRHAMVVPLSDDETAELRASIIGVHEFLTSLGEVKVAEEATGELADFVRRMVAVAGAGAQQQARVRELIGRAAFARGDGPARRFLQ